MYADTGQDRSIVQKYGGTSVGSIERIQSVASRVALQYEKGWRKIAIVVSAMSGETNRMVELVRLVNPKAAPRHYDMAVAAGEQVSTALMAAALEAAGVPSRPFLAYQLGILTDDFHSQAHIRSIETTKIEACWAIGQVPVVAGFQGVTDDMELTTLGRGGSDTSAVALAVALKAGFCEINTDVEGVFTADPRVVPEAKLVEVVDYDSALEMAALGSKVLHSRCVELGAKYKMPIVVRHSFTGEDSRRTRIMAFSQEHALEAPVVTGVSLDRNVAKVTLSGLRKNSSVLSEIFAKVARVGVNVDIIVQDILPNKSTMRVGFTVAGGDLDKVVDVIHSLKDQEAFSGVKVATRPRLAKVSVVGLGMRSYAGVASRTFETLAKAGIDILMVSTSEIKISCVVNETDGEKATQTLHKDFF